MNVNVEGGIVWLGRGKKKAGGGKGIATYHPARNLGGLLDIAHGQVRRHRTRFRNAAGEESRLARQDGDVDVRLRSVGVVDDVPVAGAEEGEEGGGREGGV